MAPNICGKCGEKLPDNGLFATCSVCSNGLHLDKCSVKTKSWHSLGVNQANWICATCRSKKRDGSTSTYKDSEDDLASGEDFEVSSLGVQKSILEKVNALLDMREKLCSIENSMSFLATKYDALLNEVTGLREENKDLRKEVETLKTKETSTRQLTDNLVTEMAEMNQYGRRVNLEIHGVEIEGEAGKEDINKVLSTLAKNIQVAFDPKEIHQAHRLQARRDGKPPTLLIQFYSKTTRDTWLTKGRKAKLRDIFFGENLCPYYRHLLREAKLKCKTLGYEFVWVKGGRIAVKREENDKHVIYIKHENDLKKIR